MGKKEKSLEEIGKNRRIKMLKRILPFCKKGAAIDIGCKFGHSTNFFYKNSFNVKGIDINKSHILKAKKNYKEINFYVKDASKGLNKKYDLILLIGVLEEIQSFPLKVLKTLRENLNPGGRVVIQVRNTNSLKRRFVGLFGLEPVDVFSSRLWIFTKKRLVNVIKAAGFESIKITYNGCQSFKKFNIPVPGKLSEEIWAIIK